MCQSYSNCIGIMLFFLYNPGVKSQQEGPKRIYRKRKTDARWQIVSVVLKIVRICASNIAQQSVLLANFQKIHGKEKKQCLCRMLEYITVHLFIYTVTNNIGLNSQALVANCLQGISELYLIPTHSFYSCSPVIYRIVLNIHCQQYTMKMVPYTYYLLW